MTNRSGARLGNGFTMEWEHESFSNRAAIWKILPENNAFTRHSICLFLRTGERIMARQNRGGGTGAVWNCRKTARTRHL